MIYALFFEDAFFNFGPLISRAGMERYGEVFSSGKEWAEFYGIGRY
jgi:hypothetical protein